MGIGTTQTPTTFLLHGERGAQPRERGMGSIEESPARGKGSEL